MHLKGLTLRTKPSFGLTAPGGNPFFTMIILAFYPISHEYYETEIKPKPAGRNNTV